MDRPNLKDDIKNGQVITFVDVYDTFHRCDWASGLVGFGELINCFLERPTEPRATEQEKENETALINVQNRLRQFIGENSEELINQDKKRYDAFTKLVYDKNRSEYIPFKKDVIPQAVIDKFETLFQDELVQGCRVNENPEYFKNLPNKSLTLNSSSKLFAEIYNLANQLFNAKIAKDESEYMFRKNSSEVEVVSLLSAYLVISDEIFKSGVPCDLSEIENCCAARFVNFIEKDLNEYRNNTEESELSMANARLSLSKLRECVVAIAGQIHNGLETKIFKDNGYYANFFHDRRIEEIFARKNNQDLNEPVDITFIDGIGRISSMGIDLMGEGQKEEFNHSLEDMRTQASKRLSEDLNAVELVRYIANVRKDYNLYEDLRKSTIESNLEEIYSLIEVDVMEVYNQLIRNYTDRINAIKATTTETATPNLTKILGEKAIVEKQLSEDSKEKIATLENAISGIKKKVKEIKNLGEERFEKKIETVMKGFDVIIALDEKLFSTMDNYQSVSAGPTVRETVKQNQTATPSELLERVGEVTKQETEKIREHSREVFEKKIKKVLLDEKGAYKGLVFGLEDYMSKDSSKQALQLAFPSRIKNSPLEAYKFVNYAITQLNNPTEEQEYYFADSRYAEQLAKLSEEGARLYTNEGMDYNETLDSENYFEGNTRRERLVHDFAYMPEEKFSDLSFIKESKLFRESIVNRGRNLSNNQEEVVEYLRDISLFCDYLWEREPSGFGQTKIPAGQRIEMLKDDLRKLATAIFLTKTKNESLSMAFCQTYITFENVFGVNEAKTKAQEVINQARQDVEIICGTTLSNLEQREEEAAAANEQQTAPVLEEVDEKKEIKKKAKVAKKPVEEDVKKPTEKPKKNSFFSMLRGK